MNLYVSCIHKQAATVTWWKSYGVRPARDGSRNPDAYTFHTEVEDEPLIDQTHRAHPVSPMGAVNGNKW